jgi:hypothetical protein
MFLNKDTESRIVAIDVEEIVSLPRGAKVYNALLASKGKLYRTARGRLAIQIRPEIFEKLKAQLKIDVEDGLDGTKNVKFL